MTSKNDQWIHDHYEEIIEKYAGKSIAVANEELFVAETMKTAYELARQKYQDSNPSIMRVPHAEDFVCAV
jgi:hypothetical protein